jgi:hypothetical protein
LLEKLNEGIALLLEKQYGWFDSIDEHRLLELGLVGNKIVGGMLDEDKLKWVGSVFDRNGGEVHEEGLMEVSDYILGVIGAGKRHEKILLNKLAPSWYYIEDGCIK